MQDSGSDGSMTLAFDLEALKQLADAQAVFDGARRWSSYVGVVSDEPTYVVTNYTRKRRIRQDFFSGPKEKGESLASVKQQFDTDRHVYIGTTESDSALAEEHGWEYLDVEEAAEAAEWALAEDEAEPEVTVDEQRDDWP